MEKRAAREALRQEVKSALAIREDQGVLGRTVNRNDPNSLIQIYTPEWQTKMKQAAASITKLENKSSGMGAYDAGTAALLKDVVGDLESRGSQSDVRLRGVLAGLDRADEAADAAHAGMRARKLPDETVEPLGGMNAPKNKVGSSGVKREE